MTHRKYAVLMLVGLVVSGMFVDAPAVADGPATRPAGVHAPWDAILSVQVVDGLVRYPQIKAHHAEELKAYLDSLAGVRVDELPRDEQLAFYINLYNATMIQAVIDRYKPGYSPAEGDYRVFKEQLVRVNGQWLIKNRDVAPQ